MSNVLGNVKSKDRIIYELLPPLVQRTKDGQLVPGQVVQVKLYLSLFGFIKFKRPKYHWCVKW